MEKKLKTRTMLKGKAPSSLLIADEYYLEQLAKKGLSKKDKDAYKSLIFDKKKIGKTWEVVIFVDNVDYFYDGMTLPMVDFTIGLAPCFVVCGMKLAEVYAKSCCMKSNVRVEYIATQKDLGCDTASFSITAGDKYEEFSTGADGYYGDVVEYKKKLLLEENSKPQDFGFKISLGFDGDLFDSEEIVKTFAYLFDAKTDNLLEKATATPI